MPESKYTGILISVVWKLFEHFCDGSVPFPPLLYILGVIVVKVHSLFLYTDWFLPCIVEDVLLDIKLEEPHHCRAQRRAHRWLWAERPLCSYDSQTLLSTKAHVVPQFRQNHIFHIP